MISVILYGRNDGHGYNLHKRAALSLNCLASVLTPSDEIIFVDYNTPQTLPTFIESIADTLTDACIERLRVFRVPEALHKQAYDGRTHLNAVEPLARNIAARRANQANRWLLSTNTDMIFLPRDEHSPLSTIVAPLPHGLYHLPRFELPEAFWEGLPRLDPEAVKRAIAQWSPQLCFDETTLMDEWMRYDAPGDFQLFPRESLLAINGFDERMCHGWHVDSNLARRLWIHFGETRSLATSLRGYHCNHSRVASIYQGQDRLQNDESRFIFSLERADVPEQSDTWGLPDAKIEEITIERGATGHFATRVAATMSGAAIDRHEFRYAEDELFWINTAHVFPHLASALEPLPVGSRIAYVGFNGRLAGWLGRYCTARGFHGPSMVSSLVRCVSEHLTLIRESFDEASMNGDGGSRSASLLPDVVVVDFSLDNGLKPHFLAAGYDCTRAGFRPPLPYEDLCDTIIDLARRSGEAPSQSLFVFVSDFYHAIRRIVDGNFNVPSVSLNCRVRMGYARRHPAPWFDAEAPTLRGDISRFSESSWDTRSSETELSSKMRRSGVWLKCDDHALKYRHGWRPLDRNGAWTSGSDAMLTIIHAQDAGCDLAIEFEFSRIGPASVDRLEIDVTVGDKTLAHWTFTAPARRRRVFGRRIVRALIVPSEMNENGRVNVEFAIRQLQESSIEDAFFKRGARGMKIAAVKVSRWNGNSK